MSLVSSSIEGAIKGIGGVADELFTSDHERAQVDLQKASLQLKKYLAMADKGLAETREKAENIRAEIKGESWLQRNWRPLTMMVFVTIIANNHIIYPYLRLFWNEAPQLPELSQNMWDLLKIGMGGYVVGRSGEKAFKTWKEAQIEKERIKQKAAMEQAQFQYHGATYGMFESPSVGNPKR